MTAAMFAELSNFISSFYYTTRDYYPFAGIVLIGVWCYFKEWHNRSKMTPDELKAYLDDLENTPDPL
jgi:hypothetical protein